jgi:hypothetical protein
MTTATLAPPRPSAVMALLSSGVPLSLLLDLALGPNSRELFATETPRPGTLPVRQAQ